MMSMAGVAWAMYTILGQGWQNPLTDTASNFIKSIPFVGILTLIYLSQLSATPNAWFLAISSGAITSGLGFAIWYAGLRDLSTSQAGGDAIVIAYYSCFGWRGIFQ